MIRVILHHEFLEFDNGMLLDFISPEMFVALNIHKEFKGFEEFLIYIYVYIWLQDLIRITLSIRTDNLKFKLASHSQVHQNYIY